MSTNFDLLEYGSQVYEKVDTFPAGKQLLFEAGLCEVLYTLVVVLAEDENPPRLAAYRQGLDVIRLVAQGDPQPEAVVLQARDAVDSLIPDDDAPGWSWATPLWQNVGISVYYTLGVVAGDGEAGFPLSHYIEAADYIAQSTSGLNTPLASIEREPIVVQARQVVADMVQTLENMDVTLDAVAVYYSQLAEAGRSLASIAERLREDARNRGVNI
ncbi:hypothetical protein Srot_1810 [Segniliparus rotundus DSM 44985]|uniref:Uncharacterized protein n=1 Tax=Segniliparus rotundus (strain ATCC BAA-972 / CDC 1076 / CIP 108378 / DSM 44985 / JCM 13578) TaxID=640132 RepID=D6Z8J0_SEGRD|nr:hypothetical protein [Segniliparus rotundus]ADG98270.1 hypothetical protein Srot_1810 [Segniliparus rotundus DSM 44985]